MFLDCPAYLDHNAARCGLPAEVRCRYAMRSTDGPVECAMIRCPAGHWFTGPIAFLTLQGRQPNPGVAAAVHSAGRDNLPGVHNCADDNGNFTAREVLGKTEQKLPRPNGAPAYYLGRPASFWITTLGTRDKRTALVSAHRISAVAAAPTAPLATGARKPAS